MTETASLSLQERLEAARRSYQEIKRKRAKQSQITHGDSGEDGSDIVATLRARIQELEEEIKKLNETIEQQKATIKKLRNETSELKLDRMDLDDRIAELESQMNQMQPEAHEQLKMRESTNSISGNAEETVDFKERLMKWKNWQVDIRLWNTATRAEL